MRSTSFHVCSYLVARFDMLTDSTLSKGTLDICITLPLTGEVVDGWIGGMVDSSGDIIVEACVIRLEIEFMFMELV